MWLTYIWFSVILGLQVKGKAVASTGNVADTKVIKRLLKSDVTGWRIEKATGISRTTISNLRLGKQQLERIELQSAIKLTDYQKENEQNG